MDRQIRIYIPLIFMVLLAAGFFLSAGNSSLRGSAKALNCTNNLEACHFQEIEKRPASCNDWYPSEPVEKLECEMTAKSADQVSLITDPGNYITGVFTDADYRKEVFHPVYRDPADIEFLPGGKLLLADKYGFLQVFNRSMKQRERVNIDRYIDNEAVREDSSVGIRALAVDPDFKRNRYIYLYYYIENRTSVGFSSLTDRSSWTYRLARFQLADGEIKNQEYILNVSSAFWHSGAALEFGPEDKLWLTTGDSHDPPTAQNLNSRNGKVLRLNSDGTVPKSNPFENSFVYSYGHRNPQGIAFDPRTGNVWESEHGNWRNDEINLIKKGGNYGWARYSCGEVARQSLQLRGEGYISPERCFRNWTLAPSRMTFVDEEGHPWYGNLFVAGLRGNHIRKFEVNSTGIESEEIFFVQRPAQEGPGVKPIKPTARRFRDIEYYNGSLWLLGDSKDLLRLTPHP